MVRSTALRLAYDCPVASKVDLSRRCEFCNEQVHDLSSMTEREVRSLFRKHEGETICVSYRTDAKQLVELRPEPGDLASLPAVLMAATALACAPTSRQHMTGDPEDELAGQHGAHVLIPIADPGAREERTTGPSEPSPPEERTATSEDAEGPAKIGEVVRQDFTLDPDNAPRGGMIIVSRDRLGLGRGVKTRPTIDLIREFRQRVQERRDKRAQQRTAKNSIP